MSGADEHFNRTGEPKPHIRKTEYSISLKNISGQVAVGSRAAKIISPAKGILRSIKSVGTSQESSNTVIPYPR